MRFLADESVDGLIIRSLRRSGLNVRAIAEDSPGLLDEDVARAAHAEERILLTQDRDFGRLVYARLQEMFGVIYLRYPVGIQEQAASDVVTLVSVYAQQLAGSFIVLQPGRMRLNQLPESDP